MRKVIFWMWFWGAVVALHGCHDESKHRDESVWVKLDTVKNPINRPTLQFPARVRAAQEVNLAFKVGGILQRLNVKKGKHVKQGELLAQLNPRDYELQLQAAESEYAGIKADAERVFALYADSVATPSDYDKARYGLEQIAAKCENAKNQLADTKLYAPFDGFVKTTLFDPPTVVGAGMPVVVIQSSEVPEIEINVPAATFARLADVESYTAKFDLYDEPIHLREIAVSPDVNVNQLYTVRLALPTTTKPQPAAGMSAMVEVRFRDRDSSKVAIPAAALFCRDDETFVWVYEAGSVMPRRVVVTALHRDGSATITSGLTRGELIVAAGAKSLKEHQRVKPLPARSVTNTGDML